MSVVPGAWQTEVGESRLGISVQGYIEYEIGFPCLHTCLIVYGSLGDVFPSALPGPLGLGCMLSLLGHRFVGDLQEHSDPGLGFHSIA